MKVNKEQVGTDLKLVFGDDIKVIDFYELSLDVTQSKEEELALGIYKRDTEIQKFKKKEEMEEFCDIYKEWQYAKCKTFYKELKEGDTIPLVVELFKYYVTIGTKDYYKTKYQYGECKVSEVLIPKDKNICGIYKMCDVEKELSVYGMSEKVLIELGYTNQKYAIKVKDVIWFDDKDCKHFDEGQPIKPICKKCPYGEICDNDFACNKPTKTIRLED